MKRLYLLRHALTLPTVPGGRDFERVLAPQGESDARALGIAMAEKSYHPQLIYCSPTQRTQRTCALIQTHGVTGNVVTQPIIYEGGRSDIFALIKNTPEHVQALLIVGHNPSMHELAAMLAAHEPETFLNVLAAGYRPGMLCVLDCPRAAWADLQPGENRLIDIITSEND
ncbi:MAG: histidine phosphatase family protein [Alphaproteobacteria bacterium]|nr:histidine phosphatase family protein [Alphaproteobacteria bacterium]